MNRKIQDAHEANDKETGGLAPAVCQTRLTDALIIGSGPTGIFTALALAHLGFPPVLAGPAVEPAGTRSDTRTTAVFGGGITMLRRLGVWNEVAEDAAPLCAIRIVDATDRLFRAPETLFTASDLGRQEFGFNIPNSTLVAAAYRALVSGSSAQSPAATASAEHTIGEVANLSVGDDRLTAFVRASVDNRPEPVAIPARVTVAADGRRSVGRQAAGIGVRSWNYDQSAIACSFEHSLPHDDVSNEFHYSAGPVTTVPLPGNRSSLVWVDTPASVKRLLAMSDAEFAAILHDKLHGILGGIANPTRRASFPLSGLHADRMAANRVILVGEAAHVIPPIGAQGLNLGLRDAAAAAESIADALRRGDDPGGSEALERYQQARQADVHARITAVDLLNRSLLSDLLPAQAIRGAGLHALNLFDPLRRAIMQRGVEPVSQLPRLMRPLPTTRHMQAGVGGS